MASHRSAGEGGVDATGVAQRIFVMEAAVQVEVQREVTRRLGQLHQQAVLLQRLALRQRTGLLCQHRKMRGQRTGAHSGAHAQQYDQARLVRVLRGGSRSWRQGAAQRGLDADVVAVQVQHVAQARPQCNDDAFHLAGTGGTDGNQCKIRFGLLQLLRQHAGGGGMFRAEIQQHKALWPALQVQSGGRRAAVLPVQGSGRRQFGRQPGQQFAIHSVQDQIHRRSLRMQRLGSGVGHGRGIAGIMESA